MYIAYIAYTICIRGVLNVFKASELALLFLPVDAEEGGEEDHDGDDRNDDACHDRQNIDTLVTQKEKVIRF